MMQKSRVESNWHFGIYRVDRLHRLWHIYRPLFQAFAYHGPVLRWYYKIWQRRFKVGLMVSQHYCHWARGQLCRTRRLAAALEEFELRGTDVGCPYQSVYLSIYLSIVVGSLLKRAFYHRIDAYWTETIDCAAIFSGLIFIRNNAKLTLC